jgi:hypothetical protein
VKRPRIAPEQLAELGDRVPEEWQPDMTVAADLVGKIDDLLRGQPSWVQSIVLAELTAMWVLRFDAAPGSDPRVQQRFRERMLRHHIAIVRGLVQSGAQANDNRARGNDGSTAP